MTEKHHKGKNAAERILKFTEAIKEGPYYVCVICNRCLYFRSVILFKIENYEVDRINFYHEVVSPDGKLYTCYILSSSHFLNSCFYLSIFTNSRSIYRTEVVHSLLENKMVNKVYLCIVYL